MCKFFAGAIALAVVVVGTTPAAAQLLGGLLGGGNGDDGGVVSQTVNTVTSTVNSVVGGVTGGSGNGSSGNTGGVGVSVSVPGVADVGASVGGGSGVSVGASLLGGGGANVGVPIGNGGLNVELPGGGLLGGGPGVPGAPGTPGMPGGPGGIGPGGQGQLMGNVRSGIRYRGGAGGGLDIDSSRLRLILAVLQNRAWAHFVKGRSLCLPRFGVANVARWVRPSEQQQLHRLLGAFVDDIALLRDLLNRCRNGQHRHVDIGRVIAIDLRPDGQLVVMTI